MNAAVVAVPPSCQAGDPWHQSRLRAARVVDGFERYDQMMNTESSKTTIYRMDNYANLVPEMDPGFLEVQFAYGARRYGMTPAQLRERDREAEECLTAAVKEITVCQEATRWGLSVKVYRERSAKIKACELGHDDRRILQASPPGRRRDHPLVLKQEACQQKIMLGR